MHGRRDLWEYLDLALLSPMPFLLYLIISFKGTRCLLLTPVLQLCAG